VHDFLLAKQIIDKVLEITQEKKLEQVSKVFLEVGTISMAHDSFDEHPEEINLENLQFGLESIAKDTILKDVKFNIKKTEGDSWKITNIEVK